MNGEEFIGSVFYKSGIESIQIPSTLKVIDALTFSRCKNLKRVEFSEGLEKIGYDAFSESGVENIILPSSVKTISVDAFAWCKHLNNVQLNEGLEVLGETSYFDGINHYGRVF